MAFGLPAFKFNFNIGQVFALMSGINANFCLEF